VEQQVQECLWIRKLSNRIPPFLRCCTGSYQGLIRKVQLDIIQTIYPHRAIGGDFYVISQLSDLRFIQKHFLSLFSVLTQYRIITKLIIPLEKRKIKLYNLIVIFIETV
jgi:hypothetical protein